MAEIKSKFQDISGQKFGMLTAVSYSHRRVRNSMWLCVCECGVEKVVARNKLIAGSTVSCGCKRYSRTQPATTHGHSKTTEYLALASAKGRCFNKNNPRYEYYGGRGITMCERWVDSFENFIADMGWKEKRELSLDRIDPYGNYEPSNCRWVTLDYQKLNKRSAYIDYLGEKVLFKDLCIKHSKKPQTVKNRINRGMSLQDALTKPLMC